MKNRFALAAIITITLLSMEFSGPAQAAYDTHTKNTLAILLGFFLPALLFHGRTLIQKIAIGFGSIACASYCWHWFSNISMSPWNSFVKTLPMHGILLVGFSIFLVSLEVVLKVYK
ncbi:MAG: hypothetical protein V4692_05645, partial [Bdellovibrionota bacterium]